VIPAHVVAYVKARFEQVRKFAREAADRGEIYTDLTAPIQVSSGARAKWRLDGAREVLVVTGPTTEKLASEVARAFFSGPPSHVNKVSQDTFEFSA